MTPLVCTQSVQLRDWAGLLPDLRAYQGLARGFPALFGLKHWNISRISPERAQFLSTKVRLRETPVIVLSHPTTVQLVLSGPLGGSQLDLWFFRVFFVALAFSWLFRDFFCTPRLGKFHAYSTCMGDSFITTTGADASGRNTSKNQYWQSIIHFLEDTRESPEMITSTGAKSP